MVVAESSEKRMCYMCQLEKAGCIDKKKAGGGSELWWCPSCRALDARIYRMKESHGGAWQEYRQLDKESRVEFYRKAVGLFQADLRKCINECVIQTRQRSSTVMLDSSSEWLDEEDVRTKFKGKPAQIEHLLNNAKTWNDPSRGVKLLKREQFLKTSLGKSLTRACALLSKKALARATYTIGLAWAMPRQPSVVFISHGHACKPFTSISQSPPSCRPGWADSCPLSQFPRRTPPRKESAHKRTKKTLPYG